MRLLPSSLLLLLAWLWGVAAVSSDLCVQSCQQSLQLVSFNDTDPVASKDSLGQLCRSSLALSSNYLCLGLKCGAEARDAAVQTWNSTCHDMSGRTLPDFQTDFEQDAIERMRRINVDDTFGPGSPPLGEVVLPSDELFDAWFGTLDAVAYVQKHHFLYGMAMALFWTVVVSIGAVHKLAIAMTRFCRGRKHRDLSSTGDRLTSTRAWLKRNITIPATFGYRCAQNVWWATIPPRIQTLTITAFLIVNILCSIYGYKIISNNLYFPTTTQQTLRYVSDRTGIMAFANFPVIWLFGMRNSVAIWLTGWDFGTYNNFHRWCARVATVQAVVHSIGYTALIFIEGGWDYYAWWFSCWFWNAGQMATVLMCALLICSAYWIRRRHYETFLIIHIALSVLVLLTMLGHVSIFRGDYDGLFWIPSYIWVLDRLLRLVRILAFNLGSWSTDATATYNASANIVELSVSSSKIAYTPKPGTYYYLMVVDDSRCWQSHPFTVASVSSKHHHGPPCKPLGENAPLMDDAGAEVGSYDDANNALADSEKNGMMTFLIRPYGGFTARLRDKAAAAWATNTFPLRVLVDGPYGHTLPFDRYDRVIFIVGGTGIVAPLSYLPMLCNADEDEPANSIEIHWAVREPALATDIVSTYLGNSLGTSKLSIELYMSSRPDNAALLGELPAEVRCHSGRPNIHGIVMTAVHETKAGQGSLAVMACGPAKLADDTRLAVVDALGSGHGQVDYFEESFGW